MSRPTVGVDIVPCGACGSYVSRAVGCTHFRPNRKPITKKRGHYQRRWEYPAGLTSDEKRILRGREYARMRRAQAREEKARETLPFLPDTLEHMKPWPDVDRISAKQAGERMAAGIKCYMCEAANKKLMAYANAYVCVSCSRAVPRRPQ